jgi:signal transduction histidine kinase
MNAGARSGRWATASRSLDSDALLAGLLGVLGQAEVWTNPSVTRRAVVVPLYLLFAGTIAFRRRRPLPAALGTFVGVNLSLIAGMPRRDTLVGLAALLVAAYSVAVYSEAREARIGLAAGLAASSAGVVLTPGSQTIDNHLMIALLLGGAWGLGRMLRRRLMEAVALERRALHAEREREDAARAAVAEERGRIARELHDIVAHGLSLMIVQAGAAEQIVRRDPERAVGPLRAIQSTGREALGDMQRLLGVLRVEDDADVERRPQPSLAQIDRLVDQLAEAGLPVELHVEGDVRALPAGLDVCGYRVVQEALTNSLKHGRPSTASVVVRYGAHDLELEVVDDGSGQQVDTPGNGLPGAGHGLVGMHERVTLYGGLLEAGARAEGGYAVRARIPLQQ